MNYLAIGNNELGGMLGAFIHCPHCSRRHRVIQSTSRIYNSETQEWGPEKKGLMQFYKCKGKSYLCGIEGRAIPLKGKK